MNTDNKNITGYKRLTVALSIGRSFSMMVILIPITLLLTFKAKAMNPNEDAYTYIFSLVSGIGALFALFGNPLGGAISDRTTLKFGRRRTWIILGSVLGSAALACIPFVSTVWALLVLWCLTQLFYNFAFASYMALVPDQVDESRRGSISGILGLGMPVSIVIGYLIMTAMSSTTLAARFGVLAAIGVVVAVVTCAMIKDPRSDYKKTAGHKKASWKGIYPSTKKFPAFTWGMLTRFFMSMTYCYQLYTSMMLMQRFKLDEAQTTEYSTIIMVLSLASMAVSSIFGGMLSDKLRKQKPFIVSSVIVMVAGLIMVSLVKTLTLVAIGCIIINFGYGIYTAVDTALIARILPRKEDAAKDYGLMNVADALPQSVVPAMASPLIDLGSWPLFYGTLAFCGLISAAVVHPIPEMSPVPESERTQQI
ncbi:MAG: MFS transporter [Clostridia bacterium]|nr:MFS transporter [Clostridia bacterium]